jgi:F-box-like
MTRKGFESSLADEGKTFVRLKLQPPSTNSTPLMAATTNAESFILRLPNELLERIVSFIRYNEWCEGGPESLSGRGALGGVTLFALSHVCRKFRTVIQNSSFWLEKSFRISDLRDRDYSRSPLSSNDDNFLCALLSDPNLRRCLQFKRDWEFYTPRGLDLVADALENFGQIPESISYSGTRKSLEDLRFPRTTSLELIGSDLDLDFIGQKFPAVKQFRIRVKNRKLGGSLKSLPFVEDLDLSIGELNDNIFRDSGPLKNVKSLAINAQQFNVPLGKFVDLQSLRLVTTLPSLYSALDNHGKEFNFTSLQARIIFLAWGEEDDDPLPTTVFPSIELGRLRKLVLSVYIPRYWTVPFPTRISTHILESGSRLRNLQELAIGGRVDPGGAKYLGRLENLERLDWALEREYERGPTYEGLFLRTELEERMYGEFMINPLRFLESVFEGFPRRPKIVVEVAADGFPDRFW